MTKILSAMGVRSSSLCSTITKVIPRSLLRSCTRPTSSDAVWGSSREVGSSRIISLGLMAITPARATLCFCPSESSWGARKASEVMPRRRMTSSILFLISSLGSPRFSSPNAMSLSTENMKIWFSGFWKSSPTFWARSPILVLSTASPSMVMVPLYSPG